MTSVLPLGTIDSVSALLAATIYQGNAVSTQKLLELNLWAHHRLSGKAQHPYKPIQRIPISIL